MAMKLLPCHSSLQNRPGTFGLFDTLHRWVGHYEVGKAPYARLVSLLWKGRAVSGGFGIGNARHRAFEQRRDIEVGLAAIECAPVLEPLARMIANGNGGVHDDQAGEPLRNVRDQRQTENAAPILADEGYVAQVEPLDERQQHVAMEMEGVRRIVDRLVAAPETQQIGGNDPAPCARENRGHLAIEITPARLSVQAQERIARFRSICHARLIDIVNAQTFVARQRVDILRFEVVSGKVRETLVRGAQGLGHR